MPNKITLSADVPVAAPGGVIKITAKVVDESGAPVPGANVKWSVLPDNAGASLGSDTSTTSDTGYASNTVTCDLKAALTVTGTLDVGTESASSSIEVGFYSSALAQPRVPQAKNGLLDEKAVSGNVQAMIQRHTDDPEVGDQYDLYWGRNSISQIDDGTSDTFPWVINIKKAFTAADVLADGDYTIYYTVTDPANNVTYSVPLAITVTGGTFVNPTFDAPEFPDVKNNIVNWNDVTEHQGVRVKIPYPQTNDEAVIFAGNTITLYMKVFDKNYQNEIITSKVVATHEVTADELSSEIIFLLPEDQIVDSKDTFDDVRGYFWYTVSGQGSVAVSGTSYTKQLTIDTVPPHLPD